jgi:Fe-S-cluster containining protein
MNIDFSQALGPVRLALGDAIEKATRRRLMVYGDSIPCKSGCDGCCSRLINITVAEGMLIYEHLLKEGKWMQVRAEAVKQFRTAQEVNPLTWFKMNIKCPVLDKTTRTCMTYSTRPAACAIHFVTSKPEVCDPWSAEGGQYEAVDMMDLSEAFRRKIENTIDGHGILNLSVPIPVALLVAERIRVQSGLSLPDAISLLYNELSKTP